jgi:hypothetical protein
LINGIILSLALKLDEELLKEVKNKNNYEKKYNNMREDAYAYGLCIWIYLGV